MSRSRFVATVGIAFFAFLLTAISEGKNSRSPYIVSNWLLTEGFSETPFKDCGSSATIQNVEIIPCDCGAHYCCLKTGTNASIKIKFSPKTEVGKLSALVHGIVAGIPMPFHFPQTNACLNSNIQCPLVPGESYTYSAQLPVLSSYPKIKVIVKWELKDENKKDVICLEIPATLT